MNKYVVYEIWTRARIVEAESQDAAYQVGEPAIEGNGMSLCNWHVVPLDTVKHEKTMLTKFREK